jgi:serine protease Do
MGDDLRRSFGAPEDSGVLIAEVSADSPASEAGLAAGDVIVKMDRKHVRYIADVYRVLDYFDPGEQLAVEIIRDKRVQTITVTLGARPEEQTLGHSWEKAEEHLRYFLDPESWRNEFEGLLERWSRRHRWREQSAPPTHQEAL